MLKACKYCGKQYDGAPGSSTCPDCLDKAARQEELRHALAYDDELFAQEADDEQ